MEAAYCDFGESPLLRLPVDESIDGKGCVHLPTPPGEPPLAKAVLEFAAAIRSGNLDRTSIDTGLATVEFLSGFEDLCAPGPDPGPKR